jgi:hypothetical protein
LDACEYDKQGSASGFGRAHEVIEGSFARLNERGDALRVFRVGKAFKESIGGTENGKSHFRPVDEGRKAFVMAFARFAEEHGLDAAAGTQRFFDQASAFDADEPILRREPAAKSHTELLEPAIVAAGEQRGIASRASAASGFSGSCHHCGA